MMYIVIYNKITRQIVRIIKRTENLVSYGYSADCAEMHMDTKPEGKTV